MGKAMKMSEIVASANCGDNKLRENIVKDALEKLDWEMLKKHLDDISIDSIGLESLLGHIRRTNRLIFEYQDIYREEDRKVFYNSLEEYLEQVLGREASTAFIQEKAMLQWIEEGYRSILDLLQNSAISCLPLEVRLAAYVNRAILQFMAFTGSYKEECQQSENLIILPQGPLLTCENGEQVFIDNIIEAIVGSLTATLIMEARSNKLIDEEGYVVLPMLPIVSDKEIFKAGVTESLAICWKIWQRVERKMRFIGGSFEYYSAPDIPAGMPEGTSTLVVYTPPEEDIYDFIANERLKDRMVQAYTDLYGETNVTDKCVGINCCASLLPEAFVSVEEADAGLSLSAILSYNIANDDKRPCGLRLVEWVRGYAILQILSEEKHKNIDPSANLIFLTPRDELVDLLTKNGLSLVAANRFVNAASLKKSSRDLFDCPLIKMADGSLMVFTPGLLTANIAQIVLSTTANLREPYEHKGSAFERNILSFLCKLGLSAKTFKFRRDGEEYQYDVVLNWGEYIFVFECKNHGLAQRDPVQAYYDNLELHSNIKQVRRLSDALKRYPDILVREFGIDITTRTIVPCVLNALSYSFPGEIDGVFVIDANILKRFFEERYFYVKTSCKINNKTTIIRRVAFYPLWTDAHPSPEDLIRQFKKPFQIIYLLAHTELVDYQPLMLEDGSVFIARNFRRKEITIESLCEFLDIDPNIILREFREFACNMKELKGRIQEMASQ